MQPGVYHEEIWAFPDDIERSIYFFELVGDTVWGATARMLRELLDLLAGDGETTRAGHPTAEPAESVRTVNRPVGHPVQPVPWPAVICPRCGTVAAGQSVDCRRCGGSLVPPTTASVAEPPVPGPPPAAANWPSWPPASCPRSWPAPGRVPPPPQPDVSAVGAPVAPADAPASPEAATTASEPAPAPPAPLAAGPRPASGRRTRARLCLPGRPVDRAAARVRSPGAGLGAAATRAVARARGVGHHRRHRHCRHPGSARPAPPTTWAPPNPWPQTSPASPSWPPPPATWEPRPGSPAGPPEAGRPSRAQGGPPDSTDGPAVRHHPGTPRRAGAAGTRSADADRWPAPAGHGRPLGGVVAMAHRAPTDRRRHPPAHLPVAVGGVPAALPPVGPRGPRPTRPRSIAPAAARRHGRRGASQPAGPHMVPGVAAGLHPAVPGR